MARFAFEARDAEGRVVRGTREASSPGELAQALQARRLSVTGIRPAPGQPSPSPEAAHPTAQATAQAISPPGLPTMPSAMPAAVPTAAAAGAAPGGLGGAAGVAVAPAAPAPLKVEGGQKRDWTSRANSQQMSLYFRQMHAMLHAGSSLSHALATSARHDASPSLRRASEEASRLTAQGTPWSEVMRFYPGLFSELAVGLVAAGESSGRVDEACRRLAEYCERDYHLQQTIKRETWYPKLLIACSILIPSVVPLVLQGPGAWLLSLRGPVLVVGGVALAWKGLSWAAPLFSQARALARTVDGIKLSLPVAGKVTRGFASAKFCHALGATMGAGVPVNRAMSLAAGACDNLVLAEAVEKARGRVLEGETLTNALAATRQFPPVAMQMLATGEASGQVEEQLEKVAVFLEGDAETAVKQAVKLLGVLVLLLVAWQIGSQVVSFYSGFYSGAESLVGEAGGL